MHEMARPASKRRTAGACGIQAQGSPSTKTAIYTALERDRFLH